jgi:hypothetical protein
MTQTQIKLGTTTILTAFNASPIGTKVVNHEAFVSKALAAIAAHDFSQDRVPGQGFLICPEAIPFVSAGDGLRTEDPTNFSPALHRGEVGLYLKRECAGETQFCALVVYTTEAYLSDPEVDATEAAQIRGSEFTHMLVAVIASSGPEAPLTPGRFTSNLAGGNKEALVWTADEIREKAKAVKDYWTKYAVVAG